MIENWIGYDPWASKLVAANPVGGRIVLDVGDLVGIKPGGNPHRWYSPANVQQVIDAIVADYSKLDSKDAGYFTQQKTEFETQGLARYKRLLATIRHRYHGVAVGASESIFASLAQTLELDLITPPSFLKAISEGTDPTAADKTTIDHQIAKGQVKVWVFNSQNSTPDVARITDAARKRGVPVTTITETLSPGLGELPVLAGPPARGAGRGVASGYRPMISAGLEAALGSATCVYLLLARRSPAAPLVEGRSGALPRGRFPLRGTRGHRSRPAQLPPAA